ncbi:MAG: glycoside hydrolase family 42, partial [Spirosoma sp.]|nr:glycoside hydrolase family 42 [Spirosoma sp.]
MRLSLLLVLFLMSGFSIFSQSFKPPHLEKKGNTVQLVVKDKLFLALGGELHNSTVSGAAYMRPVWAQMKQKHVNTVLAPVYWELIEPREGTFDFSLVDSMIAGARKQNL